MVALWTLLVTVVATLVTPSVLAEDTLTWWQTGVIYQIYPRSFMDSDGDGVGDLQGIISKLDYLKELGVAGIWLSPIYTSPMMDGGYDISNFTDIDPTFGNLSIFQNLVDTAHSKGLKVVLDFVPNHSSDQHPWFQKAINSSDPDHAKYMDYYVWRNGTDNGKAPPNNWMSHFGNKVSGDAWKLNQEMGKYYLHMFSEQQPDLNYRNPEVVQEMKEVLKFWLEKGVDGFRVDAISSLFEDKEFRNNPNKSTIMVDNLPETYDMVAQWRILIDNYTDRLLVVEAHGKINETMRYYGNETTPAANFPFNFLLIQDLDNSTFNAETLSATVAKWMDNIPEGNWSNWVTGNHDSSRVASRLGHEYVDAMNMLVMLLPGTAVTYNGEELGMADNINITYEQCQDVPACNQGEEYFQEHSRDFERNPIQWNTSTNAGFSSNTSWLPVNSNYLKTNVEVESQNVSSHLEIYKRLVEARNLSVIQSGELIIQVIQQDIFGFIRADNNETFLVAMNLGTDSRTVNLTESFNLTTDFLYVFVSNSGFNLTQGNMTNITSLVIPPKAAVVLTNNKEAAEPSTSSHPQVTVALIFLGLALVTLWQGQ